MKSIAFIWRSMEGIQFNGYEMKNKANFSCDNDSSDSQKLPLFVVSAKKYIEHSFEVVSIKAVNLISFAVRC